LFSGPVFEVVPAVPANLASTYNTPSKMYYYNFNKNTGELTSETPFRTVSYNVASRSWFWPATVTTGLAYTQPQVSSYSGNFYQIISQQYDTSSSSYPSYAPYHYKVASSFILFNNFSDKKKHVIVTYVPAMSFAFATSFCLWYLKINE
jgi:hypothetical protein